jgi:hypothetical protein
MTNYFNDLPETDEMLVEGVDYVTKKDGNGTEYKIVNFDNPKYCKRNGIVEIEALKKSNRHENTKMIRCIRDKETGLIWGVSNGINQESKELKFNAYWIEDSMTFDLSIKSQAIAWAIIKNSPFIEGSPNQHGKSVYKVVDKESAAHREIDKRTLRRKAEDIIESLKGGALEEMAINFGVNVNANKNVFMLTNELYRKMEENPKAFIDLYNDPNREYTSVFNRAVSKGVITHDLITSSYVYGSVPLGSTKELSVKYLVDNSGMAAAIHNKCNATDADTKKSMSVNRSTQTNEAEDLKKQLKAMQDKLSAYESTKVDPVSLEDINKESPSELETLKARAKELKVKGYALPHMTEEKLTEAIEKAEAELK